MCNGNDGGVEGSTSGPKKRQVNGIKWQAHILNTQYFHTFCII